MRVCMIERCYLLTVSNLWSCLGLYSLKNENVMWEVDEGRIEKEMKRWGRVKRWRRRGFQRWRAHFTITSLIHLQAEETKIYRISVLGIMIMHTDVTVSKRVPCPMTATAIYHFRPLIVYPDLHRSLSLSCRSSVKTHSDRCRCMAAKSLGIAAL